MSNLSVENICQGAEETDPLSVSSWILAHIKNDCSFFYISFPESVPSSGGPHEIITPPHSSNRFWKETFIICVALMSVELNKVHHIAQVPRCISIAQRFNIRQMHSQWMAGSDWSCFTEDNQYFINWGWRSYHPSAHHAKETKTHLKKMATKKPRMKINAPVRINKMYLMKLYNSAQKSSSKIDNNSKIGMHCSAECKLKWHEKFCK